MAIIRVPLTRGKFALIDDSDAALISRYNWYVAKGGRSWYAVTAIAAPHLPYRQKIVGMHRLLLDAPDDCHVDHIDHDGLNNTRINLRLCTNQQNQYNTPRRRNNSTGFKGVSQRKDRRNQLWRALIGVGGQTHHLGYFQTAEEAARAYDAAAKELHGEFAALNFPDPKPDMINVDELPILHMPKGSVLQRALDGVTLGDNPNPEVINARHWEWLRMHINDRIPMNEIARTQSVGRNTVFEACHRAAKTAGVVT